MPATLTAETRTPAEADLETPPQPSTAAGTTGRMSQTAMRSPLERLGMLYGEAPRRISGDAALLGYGVPLTVGLAAHSPANVNAEMARSLGVAHKQEGTSTLTQGASQVDKRTWISSPERALLETAQGDCLYLPTDEALVNSLVYEVLRFSAARMAELAENLGFEAGLRRLVSLCCALEEHEGLPDCISEFYQALPEPDMNAEWVEFPISHPKSTPRQPVFLDTNSKVAWRIHPADFVAASQT